MGEEEDWSLWMILDLSCSLRLSTRLWSLERVL